MGSLDFALGQQVPPAGAPAEDAGTAMAAQLGAEVAAALSAALERVNVLAQTGRIDRAGLRALRDEIEQARRLGKMGQQLGRFASSHVPLAPEPLDLAALMREVLLQRGRDIEHGGFEVSQLLRPAIVVADPTLGFSLLQSVLDWAFQHARSRVELEIDRKVWPPHARLLCGFAYLPPDELDDEALPPGLSTLDTISWRVLEQTARALDLPLQREDAAGRTRLVIEFPRTVGDTLEAPATIALTGSGANTAPLLGAHVLVVAARREVRSLVREALAPRSVMLDFVTSVDEAREFCAGATPHAVVHEAALGGEQFERLRQALLAEPVRVAFVQVTEDDTAFELRQVGARQQATVGRGAVLDSLAPALMFALSRAR